MKLEIPEALPKSSHPTGLHFFVRNPHPKKEKHSDCVTRAIVLATGDPYWRVWETLTGWKQERVPWPSRETANSGTPTSLGLRYLRAWCYHGPTELHVNNLPPLCIVVMPGHWACVMDGVLLDTWDSRGKGRKPRRLKGFIAPVN